MRQRTLDQFAVKKKSDDPPAALKRKESTSILFPAKSQRRSLAQTASRARQASKEKQNAVTESLDGKSASKADEKHTEKKPSEESEHSEHSEHIEHSDSDTKHSKGGESNRETNGDRDALSAYELERLKQIEENKQLLASLGIEKIVVSLRQLVDCTDA